MATAQGAPVLEPRVPAVAESPVLAHRQVRIDTRHVRLAYPWSAVTLRYVMGNEPQRLSPGSAQAAVTHVRMIGLSLFFTVLVLTWVSCGGRDGKVAKIVVSAAVAEDTAQHVHRNRPRQSTLIAAM